MTSMDPSEPPTTVSPLPRRFLRSHDDRVLGGVAGGLGRAFGVDAIIFRITLGALVFAGGVGLLIYGAALLLVPVDDGTGKAAPRDRSWQTVVAIGGGILLVVAALAALGDSGFWTGGWLLTAALVVGTGYVAVRLLGGEGPRGAPLVRLLVIAAAGVAVLLGSFVAFWGSAWATAAGGGVAVAGVVLALGAGLLVAAFRGQRRARWLALPALLVAFPAGVVSAADISLDGGTGQRSYRPAGADRLPAGYRLGAGELVVDLRGLDWRDGRRRSLDLDVGVGHAVVLVPEQVCVGARSDIRVGYVNVLGREAGGFDIADDVSRVPAAGVPGLALHARMGMGAIEVLHRPASGSRPVDTHGSVGAGRADDRDTADLACAGDRA